MFVYCHLRHRRVRALFIPLGELAVARGQYRAGLPATAKYPPCHYPLIARLGVMDRFSSHFLVRCSSFASRKRSLGQRLENTDLHVFLSAGHLLVYPFFTKIKASPGLLCAYPPFISLRLRLQGTGGYFSGMGYPALPVFRAQLKIDFYLAHRFAVLSGGFRLGDMVYLRDLLVCTRLQHY